MSSFSLMAGLVIGRWRSGKTHFPLLYFESEWELRKSLFFFSFPFSLLHFCFTLSFSHFQGVTVNFMVM